MLHAKRLSMLGLLLILVVMISACQPIVVQPAPEPEPPHGIRFDAPEYAIDGPYAVGVRYVTIPAEAENDRLLTATVWYPAQQPDGRTTGMVYEQQFAPGEIPSFSTLGNALLDAPPNVSGGPYPLVVYSHARWTFGQESPYLAEHLASRGFVVMSTDHEDNWSTAFGPMVWQAMIRRPQEVARQIEYADILTAPDGEMPGMIDAANVGVTGWSMGGETALALAGARWNLDDLRTWCAENPEGAALNEWACVDMLAHEADLAAFAGLEETPQGLWPSRVDERVHAVVPLSGYMLTFGSDGMQSVDVPTLFVVGSGAASADPVFDVAAPYADISAERRAKVALDSGGALLFFSSCADSPEIVALGLPMFCTDPVWDMDRAHDLINHFVTAFLLAELKGDADASAALAPENVVFPGIQYEATGYGQSSESLSGFVENDGVQIHYEVEGEGPPLVLMHWWSGSLQDWRLFGYVDALKDQHRLILIDGRGHGQSDKPHDQAAYELEQQAGDVVAVLDELGIEQADYFGYSMGGTIGWALAKYAPERLSSLIIGGEGPADYDPSGSIEFMRDVGPEGWAQWFADIADGLGFSQPETYAAYAAIDVDALVADVTTFSADNFADGLPAMTMPILLLAGTGDEEHAALEDAAEKLPNAQFVSLPGFDHLATFLQTDLVLEHVSQFLAGGE